MNWDHLFAIGGTSLACTVLFAVLNDPLATTFSAAIGLLAMAYGMVKLARQQRGSQ